MKGSHAWLLAFAALAACTSQAVIGVVDDDAVAAAGAAAAAATTAGATTLAGASPGEGGGMLVAGGAPGVRGQVSYAEPFRGQFHFSSAAGWMNDIDGLWFADGVFHLSYQARPDSFEGGANLHWAHATSPDLLRWQQQQLLLVPGQNVDGEAWSGSVVVDTANTSGFGDGTTAPVVAVYTSTALGTSLAYSNDRGASWQAYDDNPLAIGDAAYQTNRDPAVVWHAPSKRWVCAYWENGTTFYTSPDLKAWTRASSIAFGDVVPDFYELPLDGDVDDTRWVLQNADGAYLVGQFDGQTFVPETAPQDLDVGPSFFAARTFFRPTFPDARVVQMAWMKDGGVASAPFRGGATFPVALALKTFADGLKVTRTPIAELESLYEARKRWDAQTLSAGRNLLAGMRSKSFDLELTLDTAKTTATALNFRIANKLFSYDFTTQTLLDSPLAPSAGRLTLRILVDWGSLEVFANDGEVSYTESFAFTPSDSSLSVSADGNLSLIAADFREVGRSWPGPAAREPNLLDDAEPDVSYEGVWNTVTDDSTFFANTCHYSGSKGAALEATFTGTRVDWFGLRNSDLGQADIFLDGALVAEALDCYGPSRSPAHLFSVAGLPNTFHTLRIVARGEKNASASGTALVHDYFVTAAQD